MYLLRTSHGYFEVNRDEAEIFLKMRQMFTGHNSQEKISKQIGISAEKVSSIITALAGIGCIRTETDIASLTDETIYLKLKTACEMWAEQLEDTHIFAAILAGKHGLSVLKGFLLETYHYIKGFPDCIRLARDNASIPELKLSLDTYYQQELGHETFILECLKKVGFSEKEVSTSIPLVSTQALLNLISDLFIRHPQTVALVARVIEADEYTEDTGEQIRAALEQHFNVGRDALDGLITHMAIDYSMGHADLIETHKKFIVFDNKDDVHFVFNRIHDIKHAFDLQKLEILDYYTHLGNYVPRQKVDYFGV